MMIGLILRAVLFVFIMYLVYLKGFTDCMLGNREEMYQALKKLYTKKYGDIWDDTNKD